MKRGEMTTPETIELWHIEDAQGNKAVDCLCWDERTMWLTCCIRKLTDINELQDQGYRAVKTVCYTESEIQKRVAIQITELKAQILSEQTKLAIEMFGNEAKEREEQIAREAWNSALLSIKVYKGVLEGITTDYPSFKDYWQQKKGES